MTYFDNEVLDELVEILGEEDLCAITASFVDQLGNQLAELTAHSANAELTEISRIAHSLKGGAGNLGAVALSDVAAAVERHSRAGDSGLTATAMAKLPEVVQQTIAELRQRGYLPTH
ncbi:Hpt domain-containing protein [Chromatium okenii]|jgi:HPt (histidine-containing phosphotransfer) domain-containing protein|uniref:HPt domain-containing protein n=1 Tax=Chromatium okenii TaxID=61644 RepID=A0A2S7XV40_9GAMM|nr:Hpt domain-containing protein [Chromatium okenii]MBV5308235.1 Hpt domain-containing protein [Chromatium okenii]PQJ97311.1 hypothetical protein CXB77_01875 [Chromatium okenii]